MDGLDGVFKTSILSGVLIGIGVIVYIKSPNKLVGAMLFSTALLSIVKCKLYLFTGKIGFIRNTPIRILMLTLVSNLLGVLLPVLSVAHIDDDFHNLCIQISINKFTHNILHLFICGFLCGVLMYIAVFSKTEIIIIFCVITFILSGFEHCIADFPFLILNFSKDNLVKFLFIIFGNSLGSISTSYLMIA